MSNKKSETDTLIFLIYYSIFLIFLFPSEYRSVRTMFVSLNITILRTDLFALFTSTRGGVRFSLTPGYQYAAPPELKPLHAKIQSFPLWGNGKGALNLFYPEKVVRQVRIEGISSFSTFHKSNHPNGDWQNQNFVHGFQHGLG